MPVLVHSLLRLVTWLIKQREVFVPHDCTLQKYRKIPVFHAAVANNGQYIPLYTYLMHARGANFLGDFTCSGTIELMGENTQQIVTEPPAQ